MNRIDERQLKRALGAPPEESEAAAHRLAERADREGLAEVAYAKFDSPLGVGLVAATSRGLLRVMLPNEPPDRVLEQISVRLTPRVLELPARLDRERRELEEYFNGRRESFDLELDWRLTPSGFYRKVLRTAYSKVPFGDTASYGEVAAWAGSPRAYRAAGTALATNPIPIVVPCHRVLRASGELGLYGGGPEMKEWLLRLEGAIDDD
jgi:methylated-DNA-[protein]-cysteine S-methyltransferase